MRALITGGAKRLGRDMSLYLAKRGYDVAVHYNSSDDDARAVVDEIHAMGCRATHLHANILDETQVQTLVSRAATALDGPITVLVNNASIFEYDNIKSATRTTWDRHIESNLRAPFVLTQKFADQIPYPSLDDNSEPVAAGLIVNMLDQRVKKLTPEFSSYTIAKMGLWALTQTSARALAPKIRVNAIGPGPTLRGDREDPVRYQHQRDNTVLNRGSNPSDISAALGYFIDASAVTGQLLCVDGGQHLGWKTPDILGIV
jgi:NAD(P)-dependent dehydrogenase (short-subunit alcohol dehydrogenase family)